MQVFLTEMDAVRAGFERRLPVIVDEYLSVVLAARRDAARDFVRQFGRVGGLATQLDRLHAVADHPLDPLGGWQHRVQAEPVRAARERLLRRCRQSEDAREARQVARPSVVGGLRRRRARRAPAPARRADRNRNRGNAASAGIQSSARWPSSG
jgi:hypothetical protein